MLTQLRTPTIAALALAIVTLLAGCSDSQLFEPEGEVALSAIESEEVQKHARGQGAEMFVADLMTLNNSGVEGTARFVLNKERFNVQINAKGMAPDVVHAQHIHALPDCPFPEEDFKDGGDSDELVEIFEAAPAYGLVLLPLDDMLSNQLSGDFPEANPAGKLNYAKSASLDKVMDTLTDGIAPFPLTDIEEGEDLNMASRTVVLHGAYVKDGVVVDADVEGAEYWGSLPVACGTIEAMR